MTSTAWRNRRRAACLAAIAAVGAAAAVPAAGWTRGQAGGVEPPGARVERSGHPLADRLPNLLLATHEGKTVRFYDDLLRGKIVLINFMYASCKRR